MSVALEHYRELTAGLGADAESVLESCWYEASRCFSIPALADVYLRGALSLKLLGRGSDLVLCFLQQSPQIARELGDDAVKRLVESALRCSSKTSASVVAAIVDAAPVAAGRLGEAELFSAYLQFVEHLLAQAPRGVRPMMGRIDTLLGQLTLGGLRRWAQWGVQAHRTDFEAQLTYFCLESPESQAVLQQERKGTLFIDVQRRLGMYLRALWGRDFFLRPTSGDYESREGYRPFIEGYLIHVPDAYDDADDGKGGIISGLELYRAATAHAAAHLVHTTQSIPAEGLSALQQAAVAMIEDARVEALAIGTFPGLRAVWSRLHTATPADHTTCGDLLSRVARALLDPDYPDDHPAVELARLRFRTACHEQRLQDNRISWEIGVELAAHLAQATPPFQVRRDHVRVIYRDDNRYLWAFDDHHLTQEAQTLPWLGQQLRRHVKLMEFVNETEVETAGDDAQEIWVLGTELFPYEDEGISYNEREGKEPAPEPHHYPEWDYQIQVDRPQWVTVLEPRVPRADASAIEEIIARHKLVISRLKHLIESLQPQGVVRQRRLEEGDDIDLNAAIDSLIEIRRREQPNPRIMMRQVRKERDLAVLLLIDLSQSTDDVIRGTDKTVLTLAREASVLLADAMRRIGDPFAIHGFSSDGRHDVRYLRFKDFDAPYDDAAKARLAAMASGRSTRMGAAMRHAGRVLAGCPQRRKLLLVLTDGEPADVDVRDPQYLRHDARKAVETLGRQGITSYCLSLDPQADQYVSRIFGARNYRVLDRVERLPEQLPSLYVGLTGR